MILKFILKIMEIFSRKGLEDADDFLKLEFSKSPPKGEYQKEDELIGKRAS
jgi:hypothetical protein